MPTATTTDMQPRDVAEYHYHRGSTKQEAFDDCREALRPWEYEWNLDEATQRMIDHVWQDMLDPIA